MSSRRPPIAARRNACRIARCSNCRNRSTSRFSKATQSAMPGSTGSSALSTIGWATRPAVTDVATGRPIGVRSRRETAQAGPRRTETPGSAPRRVLRQDALKGAPVHLEAARGLRHVALAQLEDALDVLPAHAVERALLATEGETPEPPEDPMSADRVRWEHIQRTRSAD